MSVWEDITSQSDNLKRVVSGHSQNPHHALEQAVSLLKGVDRIVFAGVGSGLNATIPAAYYLIEKGFAAQYLDATEAVYGMLPGFRGVGLVLNTRSGETAELIKLAQLAHQSGIPSVAVTNEPASTVANLADAVLPTGSRWDELVVLSAYGGMLATELVLAARLVGELDGMLAGLEIAAQEVPGVLDQVIAHREEIRRLFQEARPIYLLGRGSSLASCHGGALVLEEMSRTPAIPMAAGLFRQGPLEVVDDRFRTVMFAGSGEPARLSFRLAQELLSLGAGLLWVGQPQLTGSINIRLPDLPTYLLPILEIIPCQVLAFDLAGQRGIQPGSVRYIQKVITSEEGIPNS